MSSWFQDARVHRLDVQNKQIFFTKGLNTELVGLKEFERKLNQLTSDIWLAEIDSNQINGKSINDSFKEEVEKRKNEAINSDIVQKVLQQFEGTEIISVSEIID